MSVLQYNDLVSPFISSKVLIHTDKINDILNGSLIVPPVTCEIDLADGFCNNKCPYCFFNTHAKNRKQILDTSILLKLLHELKLLGIKGIEYVGGGEPTTHPEICTIIRETARMGFNVGLVTNGLLLDKCFSVLDNLSFIRISLDAGSREVYKISHGVDYFTDVVNNIEYAKKYLNPNKIGIGYLVIPENLIDIIEATKLAKTLGVRFIQFRPATLEKPMSNKICLEAIDNINKAKEITAENFQIFDSGFKWTNLKYGRCYEKCLSSTLVGVIKANGDIPLCILNRNDKTKILGNIYENTFSEIWFNDKHLELIKKIDISKCPLPCKHDSYNVMIEAMKNDYFHMNFI